MIENPVLWKELKVRLRFRHSSAVKIAIAVVVLGLLAFCYQQGLGYLFGENNTNAGKDGWQMALYIQTILIWLLCPALASNAVTQEKEQQTWEMLIFTLLTPMQILVGKLLVRLLPILAIIAAFIPFMFFCLLRDGATIRDFILTYTIFAIWILFLVSISLFMSWAFRKTAAAIAMSFLVLFCLTIGTALIEMTLSFGQSRMDSPVIWLNPFRIAAALTDPQDNNGSRVLVFSSMTFLGITAFTFWRMIRQFRAFAID
jgi:ABC-type transport system involved in multi-copper enzyme maturation permease subunit